MSELKILLALLPTISMFLYVAFDIQWWVPAEDGSFRGFMVMFLHFAGVVYSGMYVAIKTNKEI